MCIKEGRSSLQRFLFIFHVQESELTAVMSAADLDQNGAF